MLFVTKARPPIACDWSVVTSAINGRRNNTSRATSSRSWTLKNSLKKLVDLAQEAPQTVILAGDEASLYLQATLMRVWSVIGQTPVVKCDPARSLTHFYGALNLATGQEIVMRTQLMNSAVSVLFLHKLLAAYPDQPLLLL
jgi:hypothetical protein